MHAPVRVERPGFLGRLVREPLVHFLAIGLWLFVLYGLVRDGNGDRRITVDDSVAAALFTQFRTTWQRAPTTQEMDALVESYVHDEIFYREGLALGLDRDDPTIKRRVSQKFVTIAEESEAAVPPSEAELNLWLKQHSDRYGEPPLVSFDQVAFEAGTQSAARIEAARKALEAGADPGSIGTGRMLLPRYETYPLDLIEREFGRRFAHAIVSVRPGSWEGPIPSGYGLHLVRVNKILPGRLPELSEVRAAVARDFEQDRRSRAADTIYRKLRQEYRIDLTGRWAQPSK
jgi:hypothetical protein